MIKQISSTVKIIILAVILSLGIGYVFAWTAPTALPPGGNIAAPINTSGTIQSKALGGDICVQKTAGNTKCLSDAQLAPPTISSFTASPTTIQEGGSSMLTWGAVTGAGTITCTITDPWGVATAASPAGGTKSTGAVVSGQANSATAFQLFTWTMGCTGSGGNSSATVVVTVLAPYSVSAPTGGTGIGTGGSVTVSIRAGVTQVTFVASGGPGGNGWAYGGPMGAYDVGGGGAGAFYGANVPILIVGGGGGSFAGLGGLGGTTASGNGAGQGGKWYWTPGAAASGGSGFGGAGDNDVGGGAGGAGGVNNTIGGQGGMDPISSNAGGGGGYAIAGVLPLYGGDTGQQSSGGGGGYGGGGGMGGCAAVNGNCSDVGGGGGGSYSHPSLSAPSAAGRSILLSAIGNPTSITLISGGSGVAFGWGVRRGANVGSITMKW